MTRWASTFSRQAFSLAGDFCGNPLSILIFHRVHAARDQLFPHEPDSARFEELVSFIASNFTVITLGEAVQRLVSGKLPPRPLVITFDDGYADNAEVALPILAKYRTPATFFVATGFLDGGRMWNDSVIECLRRSPLAELDLTCFDLGRCALDSPSARVATIEKLLGKIKYRSLDEREDLLLQLQSLCGVANLPDNLMMRSEQVLELHRNGMEIGAHTVRHPILTTLSPSEAEAEIIEGRECLAGIICNTIDVIAYPNGKPSVDYDRSHVDLVRRLGFKGAVSTARGASRPGDDVFQLPRYTPWGKTLLPWAGRLLANLRTTRYSRA